MGSIKKKKRKDKKKTVWENTNRFFCQDSRAVALQCLSADELQLYIECFKLSCTKFTRNLPALIPSFCSHMHCAKWKRTIKTVQLLLCEGLWLHQCVLILHRAAFKLKQRGFALTTRCHFLCKSFLFQAGEINWVNSRNFPPGTSSWRTRHTAKA